MHFKKTIRVKSSPQKAFTAVTEGINYWWGNVDNLIANKVDDEFSIFFEENTVWRFKVIKLNVYKEVHWKCIHANHAFSGLKGIKEEWLHSEILWSFKEVTTDVVEVSFEHKGLTPNLNCYEICSLGWTHFIGNSLKQYLETGIGLPNIVEP